MQRGHAEALIPMVQRVMAASGLAFSAIDRLAVTIGPGSFTGLRIGIAAARGLGLALAKPNFGISTLAAFAAPALVGGETLPVAVALDARHGMVYFQLMASDGRLLVGPALLGLAEAARKTGDGAMIFVGNAADRLAAAKREMAAHSRGPMDSVRVAPAPAIGWVARLGAAALPDQAPAKPLYLRDASVTMSERPRLAFAAMPEG